MQESALRRKKTLSASRLTSSDSSDTKEDEKEITVKKCNMSVGVGKKKREKSSSIEPNILRDTTSMSKV